MVGRKRNGAALVGAALFFAACRGAPKASAPSAPRELGATWEELPGNPLLPPGECLSWNCAGVTDPTAVVNPDGSLSVWFTTIGIRKVGGEFTADGPYLGRATGSLPSRLKASPEAAVVPMGVEGAWDRYPETPTVRRGADGRLTMWFMGRSEMTTTKSTALGQMASADAEGKAWIRSPAPTYRPAPGAWDSDLVTGPTVVRNPDGTWNLYYTGAGPKGTEGIGLLTSVDGVRWTPYGAGPVIPARPGEWDSEILEQCALTFRGRYWIWYSAYRGPLKDSTPLSIGLATSADGIHWTRHSKNPVVAPGRAGSWNDLRVVAPDVVVEAGGSLLMVAHGQSRHGRTSGAIGFWRSEP